MRMKNRFSERGGMGKKRGMRKNWYEKKKLWLRGINIGGVILEMGGKRNKKNSEIVKRNEWKRGGKDTHVWWTKKGSP